MHWHGLNSEFHAAPVSRPQQPAAFKICEASRGMRGYQKEKNEHRSDDKGPGPVANPTWEPTSKFRSRANPTAIRRQTGHRPGTTNNYDKFKLIRPPRRQNRTRAWHRTTVNKHIRPPKATELDTGQAVLEKMSTSDRHERRNRTRAWLSRN